MKKMMITGFVSTAVLGGFFFTTQETEASNWTANAPESLQLTTGQTSYTMQLGDTLWAISQRVNITVERLAEVNAINLAAGEQYNLPVGRVLTFDGDKVTVTDATGAVVNEATIKNEQKVSPNQGVGEAVNPTVTTPTGTSGTNGAATPTQPAIPGDSGNTEEKPTTPTEPENPVTPTDPSTPEEPTDPSTPEDKVYRGDIIPGVNNGAIGTWTNRDEMDAYIQAHWAENTANGAWTENYVASTNGYGWIAEFY